MAISSENMHLRNPFSKQTRELFRYKQHCFLCGKNANAGVELNHTIGRYSNSAFNASVLCHECHSHVGHTQKEHVTLLQKTLEALFIDRDFEPKEEDWKFLIKYADYFGGEKAINSYLKHYV